MVSVWKLKLTGLCVGFVLGCWRDLHRVTSPTARSQVENLGCWQRSPTERQAHPGERMDEAALPAPLSPYGKSPPRTIPRRALCKGHQVRRYSALSNDWITPFVEGDEFREELGAVAVGLTGHRVNRDTEFAHFTIQRAVENGAWWVYASGSNGFHGCERRRRPRTHSVHFGPDRPHRRGVDTPPGRSPR